jgi:tetratricopeptide repeat protein 30
LDHCEIYGRNVRTVVESPLEESRLHAGKNTVTYEARYIKALLLQLEME